MKATELDWNKQITRRLRPEEWPDGVLKQMDAKVIMQLSMLREKTNVPMTPSPVAGAHVRETGNSQHSTQEGTRLSTATDFFVGWINAATVLHEAMAQQGIGGVGIYDKLMLQGTPGDFCMFHIDTRSDDIWWVGTGRDPIEYVYAHQDPDRFHQLIAQMIRRNID